MDMSISERIDNKLAAYQRAKSTGKPVVLDPLPNGVVVVIFPNGSERNFANRNYADQALDKGTV
jgi:hypothetical protein